MRGKYAHCCSVCFVLLVCGWFKPAGKKKTIFSSVGICWVTALSSVKAPAGYHNKVEKQKARGGRWEEGKGGSRPLFSLPIVPRALSFSLSLALPTIKRGEASVGERREELWREFFDKLGTVNNKSFEISSTYPDIFKVTRPSFLGGIPSYVEAHWYPHLYFYRKSNI